MFSLRFIAWSALFSINVICFVWATGLLGMMLPSFWSVLVSFSFDCVIVIRPCVEKLRWFSVAGVSLVVYFGSIYLWLVPPSRAIQNVGTVGFGVWCLWTSLLGI